jgi:hypothetical protein
MCETFTPQLSANSSGPHKLLSRSHGSSTKLTRHVNANGTHVQLNTAKASNFGPHGNFGPLFQNGLLSVKRIPQKKGKE